MYEGRAAVRAALASFIAPPNIVGINQTFRSFPKLIDWSVNALPGRDYLSAVCIHIESEDETRLAIGGSTNGIKRVDYDAAIQVFFHALFGEVEDAMDNFDVLIDNIKDLLRSDHQFGDPSGNLVWQGAEPSIRVSYGVPEVDDDGVIDIWAVIRFPVTQMIQA